MQPLSTSSVKPGNKAGYAIWIWPAGGAAASPVTVTISAKVAGKTATPAYTVCPSASKENCTVGAIGKGAADELEAVIRIPAGTAAGKQATLSATARSSGLAAPAPASGSVAVAAAASSSPTPTPGASSAVPSLSPAGAGSTLPAGYLAPGYLPTVPGSTNPAAGLPELPNPQSSPGSLFPTVAPGVSPSPSGYSATLPNAHSAKLEDAAATFPFGTRLIGGEIAGLAVLAAALAIGIVRFSLRRPRPQHGKDPGS